MTPQGRMPVPKDAKARKSARPVICYPTDRSPAYDADFYARAATGMTLIASVTVEPRQGNTIEVPAGHIFRIVSMEGSQVGDLNLWNGHDLSGRFYSGKTRALHGTCVGSIL